MTNIDSKLLTLQKKRSQKIKQYYNRENSEKIDSFLNEEFINESTFNNSFKSKRLEKKKDSLDFFLYYEENDALLKKELDNLYFSQRSSKHKTYEMYKKEQEILKKNKEISEENLAFIFSFKEEQKKRKKENLDPLSYKDVDFLKIYLTKYGKIHSHYITKLKLSVQIKIAKMIKRARASQIIPLHFNVLY